jgi:phospholipid/cholesterol/gamma-HCH transport system substrate-binding protein
LKVEREANYIAVGSFVLLLLVMGTLFVYWYADSREHRDYDRYEIYFDGSVSGLSRGGPVRYLGVDVGRVERIRIDPRAVDRVQVIADIDATTPISDRTLAQLSLQGVTGLLFIDLEQQRADDTGRRILAAVPSEHYPVIRSSHSDFDQFLSSLPELTTRLNELIERSAHLLSDANIRSMTRLIGNLDQAAARLPASARGIEELLGAMRDTTSSAQHLIDQLHGTTQAASIDFLAAVQKLHQASDNLASSTATLNAFATDNGAALSGFVTAGLPELEALLRDTRTAAQQITELSRDLDENPSRLIYRQPEGGVVIPR